MRFAYSLGGESTVKAVILLLTVAAFMAPPAMLAQVIRPDVEVGMVCLDVATGKTVWRHWFGRKLMFTGYQFYNGKAAVHFYKLPGPNDERDSTQNESLAFLDMKTGRIAAATNMPLGSSELVLSNGWRSHGVTNLTWDNVGWNNAGPNLIYFFDSHSNVVGKTTLPAGAYAITNWNDVLVYSKRVKEHTQLVDHLFGQTPGEDNPLWEFILPKDIPSLDQIAADFIGPTNYLRTFAYNIGKDSIFVFGGGTLFSIAPTTGIVEWRSSVSSDPVVKRTKTKFDFSYVTEAGGDLLLLSDQTLLRFNKASRRVVSSLRDDIDMDSFYQAKLPVYVDGKIYCVIDRR